MIIDPVHIKFQNQQNSNAEFDIIKLEDLFHRTDIDHAPDQPHIVEFFIIILIEEGRGLHTVDFTTYEYKAGSLFTIRKDQLHKFHESKSVKGSLLLFTDGFLVSYLEKVEALKSLQLFNEFLGAPKIQLSKKELKSTADILDRIRTEYFNINDEYSLEILRSELHILIAKLSRFKSTQNEVIFKRKYLNAFIDFQNLIEIHATTYTKVNEYAKLMGVSAKTLNTISRTIINKTAKEFIDDVCIIQIKRLLINTDLSIKEIAHVSGFDETTNFYKYFRRLTNQSPEQFRRSFR